MSEQRPNEKRYVGKRYLIRMRNAAALMVVDVLAQEGARCFQLRQVKPSWDATHDWWGQAGEDFKFVQVVTP